MKKIVTILLAAMMAVTALTGCSGGAPSTSAPASSAASSGSAASDAAKTGDGEALKIGFVVAGRLGDQSTNDRQHQGLKRYAEETGATLSTVEVSEFQDHEINARNFAEQGYDLVIMGLAASNDLVATFASEYPDTMFWVNQGTIDDQPNVACTRTMPSESNFLAGAFSVYLAEAQGTDKVGGWIGGQRNPALERAQYGFTAGAQYAGGDVSITYVGNFTDAAKCKEMAVQMYNSGIRTILGWAGGAGQGVMQAADSMSDGYYALAGGGADGQFFLSEEKIIACATEDAARMTYEVCKAFEAGTLKSGITYQGVKDEVCNFLYSPHEVGKEIPQEVKDKIDALKAEIVNGTLVPPSNEEEYNAFVKDVLKK